MRARKQLAELSDADAALTAARRRAGVRAMRTAAAKLAGSARPRAGDVERGAVVGAGAHERQAERDVDAVLDAEVLHRDQAVVVGHRDDDVELARMARRVARAHEDRVGRERAARVDALGARRLHRRRDDAQLLVAEQAAFAGVRVEAGDGDARRGRRRSARAAACAMRIVSSTASKVTASIAWRSDMWIVTSTVAARRWPASCAPAAAAPARGGERLQHLGVARDRRCRRRRTPPCGSAP